MWNQHMAVSKKKMRTAVVLDECGVPKRKGKIHATRLSLTTPPPHSWARGTVHTVFGEWQIRA